MTREKPSRARPEIPAPGTSRAEIPAPRTGNSGHSHNNFAGKYNPYYVLCRDRNGHGYAKYVGPWNGYVEWDVWVPKILVTDIQGPIKKWVPISNELIS